MLSLLPLFQIVRMISIFALWFRGLFLPFPISSHFNFMISPIFISLNYIVHTLISKHYILFLPSTFLSLASSSLFSLLPSFPLNWFLFLKNFIFTSFYFTILYWFCHTLAWIHHGCTCDPKLGYKHFQFSPICRNILSLETINTLHINPFFFL